eukprot:SAG31_NODE_30_length_32545_cov_9.378999_2_plen_117_part_00
MDLSLAELWRHLQRSGTFGEAGGGKLGDAGGARVDGARRLAETALLSRTHVARLQTAREQQEALRQKWAHLDGAGSDGPQGSFAEKIAAVSAGFAEVQASLATNIRLRYNYDIIAS